MGTILEYWKEIMQHGLVIQCVESDVLRECLDESASHSQEKVCKLTGKTKLGWKHPNIPKVVSGFVGCVVSGFRNEEGTKEQGRWSKGESLHTPLVCKKAQTHKL